MDRLKEHFGASRFQNFLGGACPQTPLAARTFGAPNLHRLVLKSGYGPGYSLCSALRYVTNT